MSASDAKSLRIDSWTLYAVGMLSVGARLASRRLALGSFSKYQVDDYLMMICACTYTGIVISSNIVRNNGSNYATDEEIAGWSDPEKVSAIYGSKMLIVLEQCSLVTLWLVKACLLFLYARLTSGLGEAYAVKGVAAYCALGFLVIEILYFGVWCRPFDHYWSLPVPPDEEQCRTYLHHMITTTVFHISSDLLMLLIPVPMIARARLPLMRKLILCAIFSLGLLVVLVAVLNRYYNFTLVNSYVFLIWYNGEACTAVMVANIPFCWSLLRHIFSLDAWSKNSSTRGRDASGAQRLDDEGALSSLSNSNAASRRSRLGTTKHQQSLNHAAMAANIKMFGSEAIATTTSSVSKGSSYVPAAKHGGNTVLVTHTFKSESTERMTTTTEDETALVDRAQDVVTLHRLGSKASKSSKDSGDESTHGGRPLDTKTASTGASSGSDFDFDLKLAAPSRVHQQRDSQTPPPAPQGPHRDVELGL